MVAKHKERYVLTVRNDDKRGANDAEEESRAKAGKR